MVTDRGSGAREKLEDAWSLLALDLGPPASEIVELAIAAVVEGHDGPALLELAGTDPTMSGLVRQAFVDVAAEQRLDLGDDQAALWRLVRRQAQAIVDGELDPLEGAEWIWTCAAHDLDPEGDLRIFVGLASEAEDHPEAAPLIRDQIRKEAVTLLARGRPRTWLRLQARQPDGVLVVSANRRPGPLPVDRIAADPDASARLATWSADWQAVVDRGGFESAAAARAFVRDGEALAVALQGCVGPDFHVEYQPEPVEPPGLWVRTRS